MTKRKLSKKRWSDLSSTARTALVTTAAVQVTLQVIAARKLHRLPAEQVRGGRKWPWALTIAGGELVGASSFLLAHRGRTAVHEG